MMVFIQTKGKGLVGGKLFELALNPSDWIDDKSSILRVKMSHTDDNIDTYISKKTRDEWHHSNSIKRPASRVLTYH